MALGYARVSLSEENIDNQINEIQKFAQANSIQLLKIFTDVGVSGAKPALEREGFRQMLTVANALGIKTIIAYDLTRLGRELFDVVTTYKWLLENGYQVLFVKHPELNATADESPMREALRKAILTILAIVAEMERAMIRERTLSALERARAQGKHIGRRPVPIPIDDVKDYLSKGLSIKDVYRLLVSQGKLTYVDKKGNKHVMSYPQFLRRIRAMNLKKTR